MLPDNYDLWKRHEEEREREREKCPVCAYCGEHITDEFAFHIDHEWLHEECMRSEYYVEVV